MGIAMIRHILKAFAKSTAYFIADLPMTILGWFIVPLALPFRGETLGEPFSQYPNLGFHRLARLPKWALPWDNKYDGMYGDSRGWWANYCLEKYDTEYDDFLSMYLWAAVRNPANYWSRNICGVDVSTCSFKLLGGQEIVDEDHPGWHFMVATDDKGREFHSFEFVFPWWFDKTHAVYGRFGWKVKMTHAGTASDAREQDRIKGHVYRVSHWKKL